MRLVSYDETGKARFGALVADCVVDLARASAAYAGRPGVEAIPARIEQFFERCEALYPAVKAVAALFEKSGAADAALSKPLAAVKLLQPIARPPKIVCVARNYAEHAREAGLPVSEIPIVFARFANTLVAPGDPIVVPAVSTNVDWEGELAIIVGKGTRGRRIGKAEAMHYVFGYSIFNDVSVRDYQFRVSQYTGGKNFRSSGPFGPVIVTADELTDPHKLDIRTTINGEVMQSANTDTMIFDVPTILEHIADFIDLEPGDVIPTGTPAGVGFKRKPPVFLKAGDTVSVEVSGIGTLTNPVIDEKAV